MLETLEKSLSSYAKLSTNPEKNKPKKESKDKWNKNYLQFSETFFLVVVSFHSFQTDSSLGTQTFSYRVIPLLKVIYFSDFSSLFVIFSSSK